MFQIIAVIVALGVILWAVNYAVPMEPMFKRILTAVAVVLLVLYLLNAFGLFQGRFVVPS